MRIAAAILCFALAVWFGCSTTAYAALPPISVSVCGEASDETKALEDARYKAARKTLSKVMAPQNDAGSVFQKIVMGYAAFTGKAEVQKKQKSDGKIQLICKVLVDQQKLLDLIAQMTDAREGAIAPVAGGNIAFFFVRVRGIEDEKITEKYEQKVRMACNDRFQRLGFQTDVEDALLVAIKQYKAVPYETFFQQMVKKIRQDYPEISVAVIGDVSLIPAGEDETGFTRNGDVSLNVVDILHDQVIIGFNESYRAKGNNADDANEKVLAKMAVNMAETLSGKILSKR